MTNHNSVAKSVRLNKERRPDQYCPSPKCLWRTGGGFCPKHAQNGGKLSNNQVLLTITDTLLD